MITAFADTTVDAPPPVIAISSVLGALVQPGQSKLRVAAGYEMAHETAAPDPGSASVCAVAPAEFKLGLIVIPAPPVPTVIPDISIIILLKVIFDLDVLDSGIKMENVLGYALVSTASLDV